MGTSLEVRATGGPKVIMAALLLATPTLPVGATLLQVQPASATPSVVSRNGLQGQNQVSPPNVTPSTQPPPEPALAPLVLAAVSAMGLVVGRRRVR